MRDTSETIDLFNKAFLLDFHKKTWDSLYNSGFFFPEFANPVYLLKTTCCSII